MNMIKTNFKRLFKSKSFYVFLFCFIAIFVFFTTSSLEYLFSVKEDYAQNYVLQTWRGLERVIFYQHGYPEKVVDASVDLPTLLDFEYLEDLLSAITLPFLLIAIFNVFFLAQENTERTINNYVIKGIKRAEIYFSGFITVFIVDFLYILAGIITVKVVSLINGLDILLFKDVKAFIFPELLVITTIAAITTFLSFIFNKRNVILVIGTIVMLGALMVGESMYDSYQSSKYMEIERDNRIEYVENKEFVKSRNYKILRATNIVNPLSLPVSCYYQQTKNAFVYDYSYDDNAVYVLVNLVYIAAALGGGYYLFSRKELT